MSNKELTKKYNAMLANIEAARIYDGRNKGVDVYICKECGKTMYTRYKDKGVTPFTTACRKQGCKGIMVHENTTSEREVQYNGKTVHNWVRPTLKWLDRQRKNGNMGVVEHVLDGGLVLAEDERSEQWLTT